MRHSNPGSKIEQVTPAAKRTQLKDGQLNLLQFIVSNVRGKKYHVEVILRRKQVR
jgi:hypothetical protein